MKFRNEEARILRRFAFWLGIFQTLLFVGPVIICIFGLACASIWGHTLTPASAYTTLAFISLLRYPLSLLPTSATQVLNALVGIERIQGFLMRSEAKLIDNRPVQEEEEEGKGEEGVDETRVCQEIAMACQDGEVRIIVDTDMDLKTMPEKGIVVTNGHFTWNEKENEKDAAAKKKPDKAKKKKENHKGKPTASSTQSFDLVEINVSFAPRSLTLIVGGVGSGKSSLLSALIGHMSKVSGNIEISGRMAYVAQSSWIVNQSLRDNILMGLPMDPERYNLALSVSQLAMDLK